MFLLKISNSPESHQPTPFFVPVNEDLLVPFYELVAMASNASQMLESALEQMDDIIAGKSFCFTIRASKDCPDCSFILSLNWLHKNNLKTRARQ